MSRHRLVSLTVLAGLVFGGATANAPLHSAARDALASYQHAKEFFWLQATAPGLNRERCSVSDPAIDAFNADHLAERPVWCRAGDEAAVKLTTTEGYNGEIELAVALRGSGIVERVVVLEHEETPGFGAQALAPDERWLERFAGVSSPAVIAGIDVVSGATFTSRAVKSAVAEVLRAERAYRAGGASGNATQ